MSRMAGGDIGSDVLENSAVWERCSIYGRYNDVGLIWKIYCVFQEGKSKITFSAV